MREAAHAEVRSVPRFADGPRRRSRRSTGWLDASVQVLRVWAPRAWTYWAACRVSAVADTPALVGVGDLEPEVEYARFLADGSRADQRERLIAGAEPLPAVGMRQQLAKGAVRQMGTAPAAQPVHGGTALVEGVDEREVLSLYPAKGREGGVPQQEQSGSVASRELRR